MFGGARFFEQSRRRRKQATIQVKNRIVRHAPILGGLFTTPDYMHAGMQWADFHFLTAYGDSFFNGTAITARHRFFEDAHAQAMERSFELVPATESPGRFREMFRELPGGMLEWIPQPEAASEVFGGMTRTAWVEVEARRLIEAACVYVREGWSADHSYRYGTGLAVVLDVPAITIGSLNSFITRFREMGEVDWSNPVAKSFSLADMPVDRVQSNLLLDPAQWPVPQASAALAS